MSDVTHLLDAAAAGDPNASSELLPLVYDELRRLAAQKLMQEKPGQTLQATALVHEAYLRIVGGAPAQSWDSSRHFYFAAAEAMRRILIDQARHKRSQKAGGGHQRHEFDDLEFPVEADVDGILDLNDALAKLQDADPQAAELAKLRLFTGLNIEAAAECLGISRRTGFRLWTYARAFLQAELADDHQLSK